MYYVVGLSSLNKVKKLLFFFLSEQGGGGCVFAVFFAPIPEKGISDFIVHGSIIQVFTVVHKITDNPDPYSTSVQSSIVHLTYEISHSLNRKLR